MSKAGVGSAVNDTTRELGGALGIALLGSVANTAYRSSIELDEFALSAGARDAAADSIGAADAIADGIGAGGDLSSAATSAFTDTFTITNSLALAITAAAAIAVFAIGRRQPPSTVEETVDLTIDDELALLPALEVQG